MKVTGLTYISDFDVSKQMQLYNFDAPSDCTDSWIKDTLGMHDQVILARIDNKPPIIIWDKYRGWQNGFEHFNDNHDKEVEANE